MRRRRALVCPGVNEAPPTRNYYYLFRFDPENKEKPVPEMTGADLKLSGTRQDFDTQTGQPIVLLDFTDAGADKFHDITRDDRQRGALALQPVGDRPTATTSQRSSTSRSCSTARSSRGRRSTSRSIPNGITGSNGAQITGIGSLTEAKDLALVLQTGALPVEFQTLSERTDVSATLGKDSLNEAKKAAIAGLIVVALFLLIFYRFLGLVAVIGLGIYAAFLYAAILLFNVTLTLPGFAGLILTIGVAADANIVIFERIKEEARAGKSVRAAIAAGYAKGFHTIIDANVVTAITALVLFAVATAGVKGFALMLLIGTVISLVTAVVATRAMLGLLAGFRWFDNPRFMGATGAAASRAGCRSTSSASARSGSRSPALIVAISIGALAVKGLNLGIDFKGGTQVTFQTPQPVALDDVRAQAREDRPGGRGHPGPRQELAAAASTRASRSGPRR